MGSDSAQYTTKELTEATLPDFERFLGTRPAPGAFTCWCMYHHMPRDELPTSRHRSRSELVAWNKRKKRELVADGRSHGILVYSGGDPVGWCQYGHWDELPRFYSVSRRAGKTGKAEKLWRITCFTVDRKHRGRGVAKIALRAAMDSISRKGGGLVEAYPIARWGAYREYLGTLSMFRKEGFKVVAPFGANNVVVRKIV
jgi:ribosomal protein S18 acetylase RimI-like enzyme